MLKVDNKLLETFEENLDPSNPTAHKIPVKVLGYGEISTTFQIGGMDELAFKRMPAFPTNIEGENYCKAVKEYCDILEAAKVCVLEYKFEQITNSDGENIVYIVQPRLEAETLGNEFIKKCSDEELNVVIYKVLYSIASIWRKNKKDGPEEIVGLDAQISNWVFHKEIFNADSMPLYLDISTPLFRRNGKETLNTEFFLKSMPFFLVWIVKLAFLKEILDRYYDMRSVLIDISANFIKEGQIKRISSAIEIINRFLKNEASDLNIEPLSRDEVLKYYQSDKFIWSFLLGCRRLDRFIKTKLLCKKYNFILPGTIKR
ncbi:MAG: hypothetical protein HQK79_14700 [Desulfobacterales bacterium]|nr:hypothetical protein [Desulfobacterales bacterium]MBF0396837.1 hypothetical protein [Desulfobacterales bacterium]